MEKYDCIIVGGGVIGSFVARELSRFNMRTLLIEKEDSPCNGASKANTGIVHSGYSPKEDTLKAKLSIRARKDFYRAVKDLGVAYKKTGSLLVALDESSKDSIYEKYQRGINNGLRNLEILGPREIRAMEKDLSKEIKLGLYSPDTGIVDNFNLVMAACDHARENGVEFKMSEELLDLEAKGDLDFILRTNRSSYRSRLVINACGLYSDFAYNKFSKEKIKMDRKKGHYIIMQKEEGPSLERVIFLAKPKDNKDLKGVIVSPTTNGNIILGPGSVKAKTRDNMEKDPEAIRKVFKNSKALLPGLKEEGIIKTFSAMRPRLDLDKGVRDDFIIESSKLAPGLINIAGVKSPGLTCGPSIGIMVRKMVEDLLGPEENKNFREVLRPYKEVDGQGEIICRCESVRKKDILRALESSYGPDPYREVSLRTGGTRGQCQGGYCKGEIIKIIEDFRGGL